MSEEASIVLDLDKDSLLELEESEGLAEFCENLQAKLDRVNPGDFEIVPASTASDDGKRTRGGVIEIISATAALITAATPIVRAYLASRGFEVEIMTETQKNGTTIQRQKIRRGMR